MNSQMSEVTEGTMMAENVNNGDIKNIPITEIEFTKRETAEKREIVFKSEVDLEAELHVEEGNTVLREAKINATQLLLIFTSEQEHIALRFSLGPAAAMSVVDEEDLEKFPFTHFDGNRCRLNFVIRFANTTRVLAVLDCTANMNHVQVTCFHYKLNELPTSFFWNSLAGCP
jgi:hypothetical protein